MTHHNTGLSVSFKFVIHLAKLGSLTSIQFQACFWQGEMGHQVQWGAFPSICFIAVLHIEFFVYVKLTLAFRMLFCLLEGSGNENVVSGLQWEFEDWSPNRFFFFCIFRFDIPSCLGVSMRVMCWFKIVINKNPKCHNYLTYRPFN